MDFEKINQDLLEKLIGEKNEYEELDYKETLDITSTEGIVFLVKDIIAMANMEKGGYIVLGIDDNYNEIGLGSNFHIDESLLNSKINSYCRPNVSFIYKELTREVDNKKYAIICINSSQYIIMPEKEGAYPFIDRNGERKTKLEFKKGDILYRNGSSSTKIEDQVDLKRILKYKEFYSEKSESKLIESEFDELTVNKDQLENQIEKLVEKFSSLDLESSSIRRDKLAFEEIRKTDTDFDILSKIENSSLPATFSKDHLHKQISQTGILERPHIENIILSFLKKDYSILVEGNAGIGKTLLLVRISKYWFDTYKEKAKVLTITKSNDQDFSGLVEELKQMHENGNKILILIDDLEKRSLLVEILINLKKYSSLLVTKRLGVEQIKGLHSIFPRYKFTDLKKIEPQADSFSFVIESDEEFAINLLRESFKWAINEEIFTEETASLLENYIFNSPIFNLIRGIPIYVKFLFSIILERFKNKEITSEQIELELNQIYNRLSKNPQSLYSQWIKEVLDTMRPEIKLFMESCIEISNFIMSYFINRKTLEICYNILSQGTVEINIENYHSELINETQIVKYDSISNVYWLYPFHYYDYPRKQEGIPLYNSANFNQIYSKIKSEIEREDILVVDKIGLLIDFYNLSVFSNNFDVISENNPLKEALKLTLTKLTDLQKRYFREKIWTYPLARIYAGLSIIEIRRKKELDETDGNVKSEVEIINDMKNILNEYLEIDSKYIPGLLMIGELYFYQKNYEKSLEYWNRIDFEEISTNPLLEKRLDHIIFRMGFANSQMKNYNEAIKYYEKINENPVYKIGICHELGLLYRLVGDLQKSISNYKEAIKLDPNYHMAKNNLGFVYLQSGLIDEAIQIWESILTIFPNDFDLLASLGTAYLKKGDLYKTIEYMEQASEIKTDEKDVWKILANCYKLISEYEKSKRGINEYIKLDSEDPEAYIMLGDVELKLGNEDKAKEFFKKADELFKKKKG